jgi:hypothetical protein
MKTTGTFTIRDLATRENIGTAESLDAAIKAAKAHLRRTAMDPGWGIEAREIAYVAPGTNVNVNAIAFAPTSYGEPHDFQVLVYEGN